jgi:hypothetical protein
MVFKHMRIERTKILRKGRYVLLTLSIALLIVCFDRAAISQTVTDKSVATVNAGVTTDVITLSDLVWQLALQPDSPVDGVSSQILNQTLQLVIDQRIIMQEARRLPAISPSERDIDDALKQLMARFPSPEAFRTRVDRVGLTAEQLREIMRQRLEIERYLDFRFRSFTVVSPQEVTDYYSQVFVPRFRRQQPGRIVPTLDEVRDQLEKQLVESKVASDTDRFLAEARDRAQITILNPV